MWNARRIHEHGLPQIVLIVELELDALEAAVLGQTLQLLLQLHKFRGWSFLVALKVTVLGQVEFRQEFRNAFVAHSLIDLVEEGQILFQHAHEAG